MQRYLLLATFGFLAQLVDGALGMSYGLTSTTLLLAAGISPATASATVHLAETGTTLMSGAAHWKLGNTDWRAVRWLALPGACGAFLGAFALTRVSAELAAGWIAAFLMVMGCYVLLRFTFAWRPPARSGKPVGRKALAPLGFGAGFLDAAGGGGWGPIATPTLLASGRMQPRNVIGTVDTSEFLVSVAASMGFLLGLGGLGVSTPLVVALLAGGMVAAPVAAWLVRSIHPRVLGVAVGGLIIMSNSRALLEEFGLYGGPRLSIYLFAAALWLAALTFTVRIAYVDRRASRMPA